MDYKKIVVAALSMLIIPGVLFGATYKVDKSHSNVGFEIRHLGISKVHGQFDEFSAKIKFDENDLENSSFKGTIVVDSIDTNNKKRDKHLRSKDFFETKNYPNIEFESTKIYKKDGEIYVDGNFTMRNVTRKVSFPLEVVGPIKGPWGSDRINFEGSFKIDRRDYGLTWQKKLKAGNLVVDNDVKVVLTIQGKK